MTDSSIPRDPDDAQRLEQHVLEVFGLDRDGVKRLAVFLLAHVLVDTRLIALALLKKIHEESRGVGLPLARIRGIADEVSRGTFGRHLEAVRPHLPGDTTAIAADLNAARNSLVHWGQGRHSRPTYRRRDVTTDAGFRACVADVVRFVETVPFERFLPGEPRA